MEFKDKISSIMTEPLRAADVKILQVNLGYLCNMACKHCHMEAGRAREQVMEGGTIESALKVLKENDIKALDITGGAPEMNPHFRYLIKEAKSLGCHIIARTNLTIFFEDGMYDIPEFYSDNGIEIVASLPYYLKSDVDRVRGNGTFQKSMEALKRLNGIGYANGSPDKKLNLVYNPAGPFLAPQQNALEEDYKRELHKRFGIRFDKLFTFTNMPAGRFKDYLSRNKSLEKYMEKLEDAFNPQTLDGLMCRHLINVGWDGTLYDCDFNQALGLKVHKDCPQHIGDFDYSGICGREIEVGEHCYGCTAGQGST